MIQRRSFLKSSLLLASSSLALPTLAKNTSPDSSILSGECCLRFYNTHTGEKLTSTFWAEGEFDQGALKDINKVLRDHRSGAQHPIDARLYDLLADLADAAGVDPRYEIISGYRSPALNRAIDCRATTVPSKSFTCEK